MIVIYENKKVKLNYDLGGHKKGDVIRLKCENGIPVARYWRDRYFDSEIDNCIEFLENKKSVQVENKAITPKENKSTKKKGEG